MIKIDAKQSVVKKIKSLAAKALELRETIRNTHTRLDFVEINKNENEIFEELKKIDIAAGKGLNVGRMVSFGVADGKAIYVITEILKNSVVVEWIPQGDYYFSDAVGLNKNKTKYVINRHTAEQHCEFSDMWNNK